MGGGTLSTILGIATGGLGFLPQLLSSVIPSATPSIDEPVSASQVNTGPSTQEGIAAAAQTAASAEIAKKRRGLSSTVLSGAQGVTTTAPVGKKQLMGE